MIKKMRKMSRSNVKTREWMKVNGYNDITIFGHSRFQKDIHFQGHEFDGIASHRDRIVLFQVKSNCNITKKTLKEYDLLASIFGAEFLWFNVIDRKGLQINNFPSETFLTLSPQLSG